MKLKKQCKTKEKVKKNKIKTNLSHCVHQLVCKIVYINDPH